MILEGHRERLRKRFAKNRFDGFHDYEVLEFLLTFIFARIDVKPLAKELLKRFGSFSKVLDASIDDLQEVDGMGEASAISLVGFREVIAYYFQDKVLADTKQISTMTGLVEMLRASIGQKENEVLFAIFLGTPTQASAFPRKVVQESILAKATSVILSHNHPGGIAEPSESDIFITQEIKKALALLDIDLQEHIILADREYFSFKRAGLV